MTFVRANIRHRAAAALLLAMTAMLLGTGCYAPLHSPGIWANELPDSFRYPYRQLAPPLNYADLTAPPPKDYILGPNDVLEVTVPDLFQGAEIRPLRAQVMASGEIEMPLAGKVKVGGLNLLQAQEAINAAYANGILASPKVSIYLAEKDTFQILVLGAVNQPGIQALPKFENDVGHALASAGGFTESATAFIEVHRRIAPGEPLVVDGKWEEIPSMHGMLDDRKKVLKIPLRGLPPGSIQTKDIVLQSGDVVVVPEREFELFWVVGQLDENNTVRFSTDGREREFGTGFILPRDRDIDVITAVAMAGYIDPIDSPTTVTVHRRLLDGDALLIKVDLIGARYDPRATVLVQPGDIIYINPDAKWWTRRTFDRVIPELILAPYRSLMIKSIIGRGN